MKIKEHIDKAIEDYKIKTGVEPKEITMSYSNYKTLCAELETKSYPIMRIDLNKAKTYFEGEGE